MLVTFKWRHGDGKGGLKVPALRLLMLSASLMVEGKAGVKGLECWPLGGDPTIANDCDDG